MAKKKMEAINGNGDRVGVGATGRVSALMMCELDTINNKSLPSKSHARKLQTVPVSVYCGTSTKKQPPKRGSSSVTLRTDGSKSTAIHGFQGTIAGQSSSRIPMLSSEDICEDRTPVRAKTEKKGSQLVEIVDLKCGNSDIAWSRLISNRFKGLSFSRLS